MKISKRKYPLLEKISNKKIGDVRMFSCDKDVVDSGKELMDKTFNELVYDFDNSKIYHLSDSFMEAFSKCSDKFYEKPELMSEVPSQKYCMLFKGEQFLIETVNDEQSKTVSIKHISFIENIIMSWGTFIVSYDGSIELVAMVDGFMSSNSLQWMHYATIRNMAVMLLFIKYAEIETKYLMPKSRKRDIYCNYINETSSPVTLLDSRWFTNLVKSDAFTVRGHFRLQPKKKDGKWTKELIWINEFEKSGYTAPARKLNQE